jgi:ribosomal protein L9
VHLEQPIKTTGTHTVTVELHGGVTADLKTIVTAE